MSVSEWNVPLKNLSNERADSEYCHEPYNSRDVRSIGQFYDGWSDCKQEDMLRGCASLRADGVEGASAFEGQSKVSLHLHPAKDMPTLFMVSFLAPADLPSSQFRADFN